MDSVRIESGRKRVAINGDPERVIEFDPHDILFTERFYGIYLEFEAKKAEFEERIRKLEDAGVDANGISVGVAEGIACMKEMCAFLRERIDHVFGGGTSQAAFGETMSLDMIGQFLEGITPYIQQARTEKVSRYVPRNDTGRVMK